jgi:hypothetical protein
MNKPTITNERNRKAARVALRAVAKSLGISVGDLVRPWGRLAAVEGYLSLARRRLESSAHGPSATALRIGDVVVADYHGTLVCGRIRAFDGSGYCYLDATHAGSCDHQGRAYDGIALAPYQRKSTIKIGRRPYASIEVASPAALGGAYGSDKK